VKKKIIISIRILKLSGGILKYFSARTKNVSAMVQTHSHHTTTRLPRKNALSVC